MKVSEPSPPGSPLYLQFVPTLLSASPTFPVHSFRLENMILFSFVHINRLLQDNKIARTTQSAKKIDYQQNKMLSKETIGGVTELTKKGIARKQSKTPQLLQRITRRIFFRFSFTCQPSDSTLHNFRQTSKSVTFPGKLILSRSEILLGGIQLLTKQLVFIF